MDEILHYLADNKTIVVGAATTLSELIVVIVNLVKQLRKHETTMENGLQIARNMESSTSMSGSEPVIKTMSITNLDKKSTLSLIAWAANPLNLFAKL